MSFRTPLEIGLGGYMGEFYAQLAADTPSMQEYIARGLSKSIVIAPGRMIDQVEAMVNEWRKNNNDGGTGNSPLLPVMIIAMSKDFSPVMSDFGVAVGSAVDVINPNDPHSRVFKVRVSVNDYRAQIVILAAEGATAHSLAMQFNLWANGPKGRRFKHVHSFAGMEHEFAAVLETIDIGAIASPVEQKNLTVLVADLNVRASIPLFQAPKEAEDNDGKPAPAGYPVVLEVDAVNTRTNVASKATLDAGGNPVSDFYTP